MLVAVNYHYIRNQFDFKYPSIFGIKPNDFENQLKIFLQKGVVVSSDQIAESIENNNPLPDKSIVITFDDGLKEQYVNAVPILKKLKIPAIFFVNTENIISKKVSPVHKIHILRSEVNPDIIKNELLIFLNEKNPGIDITKFNESAIEHYKYDSNEIATIKYILNFILSEDYVLEFLDRMFNKFINKNEDDIHSDLYMDEKQITELSNAGMLGSHSHTHRVLGKLNPLEREKDIKTSQEILSKLTGKITKAFSFPYGSLDSINSTEKYLSDNKFIFAFTMERGINKDLNNNFALSRFDNNDLPLGKNYNFNDFDFFTKFKFGEWKNS